MVENHYDAIVIGAGHNGLVTASYLAKDGLAVLVLERLDKVGGAATTDEFSPGFEGPMCAYWLHLLQGKVVDDLKLTEHGLEMSYTSTPGDNSRRVHPFPDGTFMGGPGINSDFELANQIKEFSEQDARAYFDWIQFWEGASSILHPYFLTEPPTISELVDSVRGTRREEVLEKMLTWSYIDLIEDHFEDEHVKAYLMKTDIEADPRSAGSILGSAMLGCSQFTRNQDSGIPKMSMGTTTRSMEKAATSLGAKIRTLAPVKEVIVEEGVAKGVRLVSGEEFRSFIVVSNLDPKRTFTTLFKPKDVSEETVKRVKRWKTRTGSVKFLAALSELPDLSRYLGAGYDQKSIMSIKIMPSVEYYQQSWDDAVSGKPTSCPIMGIQLTSTVEPNLVRGSGHVMSNWVLFETPHLKEGTWDDFRDEVGEQIIETITQYAPNFRASLVDWTVQTPSDIETRVGMTDGNIHHLDHIPSQLLSQRQPYRTSIENFYMCGAGTHPAGEVSGANGHNAAHAILKDLQRVAG
jgi:phytoene dehydrogenase-like protein